jgi:hypothetical protein
MNRKLGMTIEKGVDVMIKSVEVVVNIVLENGETRHLKVNRNLDVYNDKPKAQAYSLDGTVDAVRKSLFMQWSELFTAEEAEKHIGLLGGKHPLFESYLKNVSEGKQGYYEKK